MKMLDDLRGKHAGHAAFVLGSGPSLRFVDPAQLVAAGVVFTTNSAILGVPSPTYHVVCDPACAYLQSLYDHAQDTRIIAAHGTVGDVREALEKKLDEDEMITFPLKPGIPFTRDADGVSQWTTTPIAALHLAIIAGCNPIVLIGCDCRWENGRRYFHEWDPWDTDDPFIEKFGQLPHPATGNPLKYIRPYRRIAGRARADKQHVITDSDGMLGLAADSWSKIGPLIPKDIRVLNASIGSKVNTFPVVGLDVAMALIKNTRTYYVDIDGTLTDRGDGPWGNLVKERVDHVRNLVHAGNRVYLWSAQGASYARHFAAFHHIDDLFDAFLDKPDICYDDVPTIRHIDNGTSQYSGVIRSGMKVIDLAKEV